MTKDWTAGWVLFDSVTFRRQPRYPFSRTGGFASPPCDGFAYCDGAHVNSIVSPCAMSPIDDSETLLGGHAQCVR
jgi:hypothetical protein